MPILISARNPKMHFHSITYSLAHGSIHFLLEIGNIIAAGMRNSRSAYCMLRSQISYKQALMGAVVMLLACFLCLSISLPIKMVVPGNLMGGIHPASLEVLAVSAGKFMAGIK